MEMHSLKGYLFLTGLLLLAWFLAPLWNKYVAASVPTLAVPA